MPRYVQRREHQVGEFWLDKRSGSPAWHKCWYDKASEQTRKVSLGTTELDEALRLLKEEVAASWRAPTDDLPPSRVKLSAVLLDYWNRTGQKLRSFDTVKIQLRYAGEFWGDASVAELRDRQDDFRAYLAAKGLGPNSQNRCFEVLRAAVRSAWKRGVLSSVPFIQMLPTPETLPMGRPLTKEEARALYRGATQPHIGLYILLALGTGARPEALTDLTFDRVDFDNNIIRLAIPGKPQTKKYRPQVRMGPQLAAALRDAQKVAKTEGVIEFRGRRVHRLDTGWDKAVKAAGLEGGHPRVTLYSLRHTVARYLRAEGVDAWQVSSLLGHRRVGAEMTERYTGHDPAYQREAAATLDRLLSFVRSVALPLQTLPHSGVFVGPLEQHQIEAGRGVSTANDGQ